MQLKLISGYIGDCRRRMSVCKAKSDVWKMKCARRNITARKPKANFRSYKTIPSIAMCSTGVERSES